MNIVNEFWKHVYRSEPDIDYMTHIEMKKYSSFMVANENDRLYLNEYTVPCCAIMSNEKSFRKTMAYNLCFSIDQKEKYEKSLDNHKQKYFRKRDIIDSYKTTCCNLWEMIKSNEKLCNLGFITTNEKPDDMIIYVRLPSNNKATYVMITMCMIHHVSKIQTVKEIYQLSLWDDDLDSINIKEIQYDESFRQFENADDVIDELLRIYEYVCQNRD